SAALEHLRLHSIDAPLPLAPGGLFGHATGSRLAGALGFTGATLLLLTLGAIGFSLFTGMSWLGASERVGLALEQLFTRVRDAWDRHRDRKLGERAREERSHAV